MQRALVKKFEIQAVDGEGKVWDGNIVERVIHLVASVPRKLAKMEAEQIDGEVVRSWMGRVERNMMPLVGGGEDVEGVRREGV